MRSIWPLFSVKFLGALLLLGLTACVPQTTREDPLSNKVDIVTLPKFGFDQHWGGHEIPPKILAQRKALLQELAERNAQPSDFALEVTQSGWQALSESQYDTAIRRFNQAWLIYPQSAFAIMGMAMVVYERDGDIKGGLLLMESLEEPLGSEPSYWINLASMEKRADMPVEALKHYEIAAELSPDNPLIITSLVELYSNFASFSKACAMLRNAYAMQIDVNEQTARYIENNAKTSCRPS